MTLSIRCNGTSPACRNDRGRYLGNRRDRVRRAERDGFVRAIRQADKVLISTVSVVEAKMVVHGRRGQRAVVLVDDVLRLPVFEMVAPGRSEMDAAYAAFVAYGRSSGHSANLNFGDLFAYALAKTRGLPLLYKGGDFAQTDVVAVRLQTDELP